MTITLPFAAKMASKKRAVPIILHALYPSRAQRLPLPREGARRTVKTIMSFFSGGRARLLTFACLLTLYTVWGSTYLAMRVAVRDFAPMQLGAFRFLLAGGLLFAILRVRGASPPTKREWLTCSVIGLLMMGVGLGATAYAVQTVSSGACALVFGCVPLFTAAFQRAFGQALRRRELAGLVFGVSGVALVATRGALHASPLAAAVLVMGAASYSLGCALGSRLAQPNGAMSGAAQMIVAGAALFAVSVAKGEPMPSHVSTSAAIALAHLVVLGSMVSYSALGHLLRNERPALATSYAFVNPIVALGLGALFLGEHVGRVEIAAVALVLVAVALVARRGPRVDSSGTLDPPVRVLGEASLGARMDGILGGPGPSTEARSAIVGDRPLDLRA
jgi:drug/metabolite transporter (DMT)-like permease